MSVSGVSGDAAAAAGRFRAVTDSAFSKPPTGTGDALLQDAILTPLKLGDDVPRDAQIYVGRLANKHRCHPETDPGNCSDPAAHSELVAEGRVVVDALTQPMRKNKARRRNGRA